MFWNIRINRGTFDDVIQYPDIPWDWKALSKNPNITFDNVIQHLDIPWNWKWLSLNQFQEHKGLFCKRPWLKIPSTKRKLLDEILDVADLPPMVSNLTVFKNGGALYKEGWEACERVMTM